MFTIESSGGARKAQLGPKVKHRVGAELAVRDVVHNREVKNIHSLANPEALELYRDLPQLQE